MPADPRLAALPALRKLAENEARTIQAQLVSLSEGSGQTAGEPVPSLRALYVAHLALLSDLSRPASRDALARLVAEAVGLECGATAPTFARRPGHRQIEIRGGASSHYFGEDLAAWPRQHPMLLSDADLANPLLAIALHTLGPPHA